MRTPGRQTWLVVGVLVAGAANGGACKRKAAEVPAEPEPVKWVQMELSPPARGAEGAQKDWRTLLYDNGLSRYAPALVKVARPAVQLKTSSMPVEDLVIGESRIGGVPDLPPGFRWPTFKGKHLAFIAEVNLSDVAQVLPDGPLPKKGQLWFFYAWDQERWGFDPKDAGSAVVHYEADAKLARRALPRDIPEEGRFGACAVAFRVYDDIPDPGDDRDPTRKADDATQDRYGKMRGEVASIGGTSHKLLGYAEPIQGEMESECALVTSGIYTGDANAEEDPRFKAAEKTRVDWHLLMQVDSDDDANMMWGDAGRLYFWIRDQDLKARRFDKTWMIFQCG